jgi:hypothetical protein
MVGGAMGAMLQAGLPFGSRWYMEVRTEMAEDKSSETLPILTLDRPLSVLKSEHIRQIDDALAELGPFGEVRVIKQRGKLRFIQKVESMSIMEGSEK